MPNEKKPFNKKGPGAGEHKNPGKGEKSYKRREEVSGVVKHPLHLEMIPGTEGAGRVAATLKNGLSTRQRPYCGNNTDQSLPGNTIPTVAVVKWAPTMGALFTGAQRTVIAAAMFKYYNNVRAHNASVSAYSPIDLFFALEAMSGLSEIMGYIRLRLAVLNCFGSQINLAYPQALMQALDIVSSDRDRLAQYIVRYNEIVRLAEGLIIPKDYKLFARRAALSSVVYKDDPIIAKSQLIVMEPCYYYKWDLDPSSSTVGQLLSIDMNFGGISSALNAAETLVRSYCMDVDMNNLYAELRKAYTDMEVYRMLPIDQLTLEIPIDYDQVLLDQIHNANLCGLIDPGFNLSLKEDSATGEVVYQQGSVHVAAGWTESDTDAVPNQFSVFRRGVGGAGFTGATVSKHLVYAHDDQPGEFATADLCAFKYTSTGEDSPIAGSTRVVTSCGTELITQVEVTTYPYDWNSFTSTWVRYTYVGSNVIRGDQISVTSAFKLMWDFETAIHAYSTYAYLPVIQATIVTKDGSTPRIWFDHLLEGDVDNRYPISEDALDQLHNACLAWLIAM